MGPGHGSLVTKTRDHQTIISIHRHGIHIKHAIHNIYIYIFYYLIIYNVILLYGNHLVLIY